MNNLARTPHARQRMAQRHFADRDVDIMMRFGTETGDGLILLKNAYAAAIADADRIKKLLGAFIALDGGTIRSFQRLNKKKEKRKLRCAERDGLSKITFRRKSS